MKTRVSFLLILLSFFLMAQPAISKRLTDTRITNEFSLTGTTISTSTRLSGHGATSYSVSGSAGISGNADAMDTGDVYEAEMWLEASGKSSDGVPGRGNIDQTAQVGGVYQDVHRTSTGTVLYKKHNVGSASDAQILPGTYTANSLSDSVSHSYANSSYSSPTGLSVSPYCYGLLDGTLGKASGGATLTRLTFRSRDNPATGENPDDGTEVLASELCNRAQHCTKPFTATKADSHRVQPCGEKRWGTSPFWGAIGVWKKKKEDCQGIRWTCASPPVCQFVASHVDPSESHLEEKYVDSSGNTVDPNTVTRNCGHLLSASGDHTQQASCPVTNSNRQSCTVTNFYACQSHTHTYPTLIRRQCLRFLLGYICSKGGYITGGDNHISRCRLEHWYSDCNPTSAEHHKIRTCTRCSNTYQNCQGNSNPCISGQGHAETAETPAEVPSNPQPSPSPPSETPPTTPPEDSNPNENEEQQQEEEEDTEVPEETPSARPTAVCGSGHTYFTDGSYARNQHQDRTCLRCSQTYQNCSNNASACQNRRWHTGDDTAYMNGACGHSHRINEKSQHASVTCTTTNANGDTCTGGSYYACQSHTHTYPTPTAPTPTPTPTPTPPENTNENEEEEEVPAAPPAPTISYHPCGVHPTTASGVHSRQASCSTDATCTAQNFYQCQHSSHTYPAPPPPPPTPTVVCPADSWTNCGGTSSHASTCTGSHTYYICGTATAWHQDRTCTRCNQTYQNCGNSASACQSSYWHTETPQVTLVACGAASWTGCTSQLSSSTEHQVSCSGGHSYWTCGTATAWHQDRTCTRCSQTYQNCGNSASACQGSRWHTE